jgi:7-carboxy-7-deazaguanine synthase
MKKIPMVEIFETIQGEGLKSGSVTTFIRIFNCNLRCTYCDTKYSYYPHKPEFFSTVDDIVESASKFNNGNICLTGGEPLLYTEHICELLIKLSQLEHIKDIHIETNGAIKLDPFIDAMLNQESSEKIRFIMDYKLSKSGEINKMVKENLALLRQKDELKFVIHDKSEFFEAIEILKSHDYLDCTILFSPVYGIMDYRELASLVKENYKSGILNLQLHKIIWSPETRGV